MSKRPVTATLTRFLTVLAAVSAAIQAPSQVAAQIAVSVLLSPTRTERVTAGTPKSNVLAGMGVHGRNN